MSSNLVRWGRLSAMLGGVLWMVLRSLVLSTWDSTLFGFGYVFYNRMMVIPLLLLIAGAVSLWRVAERGGRGGWRSWFSGWRRL